MSLSFIPRVLLLAASCLPALAHAALGESVATVRNDQAKMRAAARPSVQQAAYTVHEMQDAAGVVIREFAGADGVVFAVSWSGPVKPDLQQLLGKYFDRFRDAPRQPGAGHRHGGLRSDDLVVRSSGHMRAFTGIAWLPQRLPAGVRPEELQ